MNKYLGLRVKGEGIRKGLGDRGKGLERAFLAPVFLVLFFLFSSIFALKTHADTKFFQFTSIDTMKYSRDGARQNLSTKFIDNQISRIAKTGATHVAVGTPYDEEFYPVLKQWVTEIRKYHMHVWFRGNFSGWEGWFSYPKNVTRAQHTQMLKNFLTAHPNLFETGDIFVSCPECENGNSGDPRMTGDVEGFRKFIITEKQTADSIFASQGKQIETGLYSMNGDVARLIMDKATTRALDGYITIDHYVPTPEKFYSDILEMAQSSGGKVVLGEFGAPIPDLQGDFNEDQQADWIQRALEKAIDTGKVVGMNYWTSFGGSTELWNDNNTPRKAVNVITQIYTPVVFEGAVRDQFGNGVSANVNVYGQTITTGTDGIFEIPLAQKADISVTANGYSQTKATVYRSQNQAVFTITKHIPTIFDKLKSMLPCLIIFCKN